METPNSYASLLDDAILAIQRAKEWNDDDRVMPCGEAAYRLNKTPQTISKYIAEGKLHKAYANGVNGVWASEVYALIDK